MTDVSAFLVKRNVDSGVVKKVSILCHDLSNNCLGRAWVLARLSMGQFDVEIIGPSLSGGIWAPLADAHEVPIKFLDLSARKTWRDQADGDILVAVKPRQDSLGLALLAADGARPVVADVDDWELAFYYDYPARMLKQMLAIGSPRNFYRAVAAEKQVSKADAVTVSSTWLQGRFGGVIVPHARDARAFSPEATARATARLAMGVAPDDIVVVFVGTAMRHKGVDELAKAIGRTGRSDVVLATTARLRGGSANGLRICELPPVPLSGLPRVLAGADIAVLPQRRSRASRAQVPAKLFDAMAMALPVVATDVSDLREILGAGGLVVEPDDVASLGWAIEQLAGDPEARRRLGDEGRRRFLQFYSEEAVRPAWASLLANLLREYRGT